MGTSIWAASTAAPGGSSPPPSVRV
jgi:hypothetical protein